jgi:DNA polymerase V
LDSLLYAFDRNVDSRLLVRRLGVAAETRDDDCVQLDMFTDYDALEREEALQLTLLNLRQKYKTNIILKGKNYLPGGTARERNEQIGGHRA